MSPGGRGRPRERSSNRDRARGRGARRHAADAEGGGLPANGREGAAGLVESGSDDERRRTAASHTRARSLSVGCPPYASTRVVTPWVRVRVRMHSLSPPKFLAFGSWAGLPSARGRRRPQVTGEKRMPTIWPSISATKERMGYKQYTCGNLL